MQTNEIPVHELTSQAAVCRIAAELLQGNMEYYHRHEDYENRKGTCAAFGNITCAIDTAYRRRQINGIEHSELTLLVLGARRAFREMFEVHGERATKNGVYWMGTRNDTGQKRRITALLLLAKTL